MLAALILGLGLINAASNCSQPLQQAGLCSVTNTGSEIELGAQRPGTGDGRGGGGARGGTDDDAPSTGGTCDRVTDPLCRNAITYSVGIFSPTIDDVARFAPASVPLVDEPGGVGVAGLPVNFVVAAAVHEQVGVLFDLSVSVRFTPASVVFSYGDGQTRTARTGGRTWAQLGLPQFSATSTSHAYPARGTYTASAVVQYTAEFNLGRGWVPIAGTLQIPTASTGVRILEARTALVDLTCLENPDGPGC